MNAGRTGLAMAAIHSGSTVPLEQRAASMPIVVAGEDLVCEQCGCLYWPQEETLIVSDLHLEKGSSMAGKGSLVPPYDTGATLARLSRTIAARQPKRIISLGDSFHDPLAHDRLPDIYLDLLKSMIADREWIWISGNHDPAPPADIGGKGAREMLIGNLVFRHEPLRGSQPGEIAGHLHPAGKIHRRGKVVRRRCFVTDGTRMILPSFGAYTGGLNIRHDAFSGMFDEESMTAVMLGNDRVFHIGSRNLVA